MSQNKWIPAGIAFILSFLAVQAPAQEKFSGAISPAEFNKLAMQLNAKNQPWASIPWKVSVTDARIEAARVKKPIFLVVNTGNCLGFV